LHTVKRAARKIPDISKPGFLNRRLSDARGRDLGTTIASPIVAGIAAAIVGFTCPCWRASRRLPNLFNTDISELDLVMTASKQFPCISKGRSQPLKINNCSKVGCCYQRPLGNGAPSRETEVGRRWGSSLSFTSENSRDKQFKR
jgi:hypothetical protein